MLLVTLLVGVAERDGVLLLDGDVLPVGVAVGDEAAVVLAVGETLDVGVKLGVAL